MPSTFRTFGFPLHSIGRNGEQDTPKPQLHAVSLAVAATALLVCLAASAGVPSAAQEQRFRSFDFPGATNTQATAITSSREIVGRYYDADGSLHGFILVHGRFSAIDYPGATLTDVNWVNDRGDIVGTYVAGNGYRGFLLTARQFTTIDYAGLANTVATGISNRGDIVGSGSDNDGNFLGFRLTNGKFSPVDFPGPSIVFQEPTMLEDDPIVGGYVDNLGLGHGYLLVGTTFHSIDCPGATGGIYLSGIDRFGRMTGEMTTSDGHQHGLLISNGECIAVDFPHSVSTYANGINTKGDIVGRYTDSDGNTHGFIAEHFAE